MPKVYPFLSFENPSDYTRPRRRKRDVDAVYQLVTWMMENGWKHGQPIYNTPPDPGAKENGLFHVDVSFVRSDDVVLCAGRPEKDQHTSFPRKRIQRAWTDLEQHFFDAWGRFLDFCARDEVTLAPEIRKLLPPGYESRASVGYKQVGCAYKSLYGQRGTLTSDVRTGGYLFYLAELWPGGPGAISVFGMDANGTAALCYRLSRDFSKLLERPGFAYLEMTMAPIPPRPTHLGWADEWRIDKLIHQVF